VNSSPPPDSTESHAFHPGAYLNEYFHDLNEEYEGLYRFWLSALTCAPAGPALELGVGPALYSAIPLANRSQKIDLADYVPASLEEIDKWRRADADAFDWKSHIRLVLQIEGGTDTSPLTPEAITHREQLMRSSIRDLLLCDLLAHQPLARAEQSHRRYSIVTAHYCTEAAASNLDQWRKVMVNISSLIESGGMFLLSVSTGLEQFRVYADQPRAGSAPEIDEPRVRSALEDAGFDLATLRLDYLPAPRGAGRPYAGTWLAAVHKAGS
jgi:hypothetical protein